MRYVILDGRRYAMRDIHRRYKEQRDAERKQKQLTLFELKEDCRPHSQRTAHGRWTEPTLFDQSDD